MSAADERRLLLVAYLRVLYCAPTAREIAEQSGIYTGHGRYDRCLADLKVLHRRGVVERYGRPAVWAFPREGRRG